MGQAFLHGNGSGGTGGTLTVTAPAGVTVTISKDGKTKTKIADSSGVAIFKRLDSGTWTVTVTSETKTFTDTVEVVTDYAVSGDSLGMPLTLYSTTGEYSGSFAAVAWRRTGNNDAIAAPGLSVDASCVKITQNSTGRNVAGTVYNDRPIDLTKLKTLRFTARKSTQNVETAIRAGIINKLENEYSFIASVLVTETVPTEYSVDVSNLEQTGYFAAMFWNCAVEHTAQFTDIRVE